MQVRAWSGDKSSPTPGLAYRFYAAAVAAAMIRACGWLCKDAPTAHDRRRCDSEIVRAWVSLSSCARRVRVRHHAGPFAGISWRRSQHPSARGVDAVCRRSDHHSGAGGGGWGAVRDTGLRRLAVGLLYASEVAALHASSHSPVVSSGRPVRARRVLLEVDHACQARRRPPVTPPLTLAGACTVPL
jgi:hypothetical protein